MLSSRGVSIIKANLHRNKQFGEKHERGSGELLDFLELIIFLLFRSRVFENVIAISL